MFCGCVVVIYGNKKIRVCSQMKTMDGDFGFFRIAQTREDLKKAQLDMEERRCQAVAIRNASDRESVARYHQMVAFKVAEKQAEKMESNAEKSR